MIELMAELKKNGTLLELYLLQWVVYIEKEIQHLDARFVLDFSSY